MIQALRATAPGPSDRVWRVLLVDGDRSSRSGALRSLSNHGCQVTEVRSLGAAQHALERGRFDAVVSQLSLGDGDGFAVFQATRRVGSRCPVAIVAGVSTATGTAAARLLWFSTGPCAEPSLFEAIQASCHENARRAHRRESRATLPVFRPVAMQTVA